MKRSGDACLVWSADEACGGCEASHFLEERLARPERKRTMGAEQVISFRKEYYTTQFPLEARWFQCGERGGTCLLTAQIIHSVRELRAFQDEVSRRANAGEWIFLAYTEPGVVTEM
jgi:hypothetical protein